MRLGLWRRRWLGPEDEHEHPHAQQRRHRGVGREPTVAGRDDQRAGARDQHGDPVPGLDHGGAGTLLLGREDLDPIRVDNDVLACREECDQQRQRPHEREIDFRVA